MNEIKITKLLLKPTKLAEAKPIQRSFIKINKTIKKKKEIKCRKIIDN